MCYLTPPPPPKLVSIWLCSVSCNKECKLITNTQDLEHMITVRRPTLRRLLILLFDIMSGENSETEMTLFICVCSGPGSSVGIATELRAQRSGDRIPVGQDLIITQFQYKEMCSKFRKIVRIFRLLPRSR